MSRRGGLARIAAGLERELAPAILQAGHLFEDEAKALIMAGLVSGKGHVASLPGEPPNNDVGDLVRGIDTSQPQPTKAIVASSAGHALPLEFGTSRMAARPYMGPAAITKTPDAAKLLGRATAAAVRKLGAA